MLNYHLSLRILTLSVLVTLGLSRLSSALPDEWQSRVSAPAQPSPILAIPSTEPLDLLALDPLDPKSCRSQPCPAASTSQGPVATNLSTTLKPPSLWFYRDLFKPGLVQNWLVYPTTKQAAARVDFVLSRNIWAAMDYLERYAFINAMGAATRRFGYNSRFFNVQSNTQSRLATYTCNIPHDPGTCNLVLESIGLNRFH